jgi:hypothetical protein
MDKFMSLAIKILLMLSTGLFIHCQQTKLTSKPFALFSEGKKASEKSLGKIKIDMNQTQLTGNQREWLMKVTQQAEVENRQLWIVSWVDSARQERWIGGEWWGCLARDQVKGKIYPTDRIFVFVKNSTAVKPNQIVLELLQY